jgi:hypothetical protein
VFIVMPPDLMTHVDMASMTWPSICKRVDHAQEQAGIQNDGEGEVGVGSWEAVTGFRKKDTVRLLCSDPSFSPEYVCSLILIPFGCLGVS